MKTTCLTVSARVQWWVIRVAFCVGSGIYIIYNHIAEFRIFLLLLFSFSNKIFFFGHLSKFPTYDIWKHIDEIGNYEECIETWEIFWRDGGIDWPLWKTFPYRDIRFLRFYFLISEMWVIYTHMDVSCHESRSRNRNDPRKQKWTHFVKRDNCTTWKRKYFFYIFYRYIPKLLLENGKKVEKKLKVCNLCLKIHPGRGEGIQQKDGKVWQGGRGVEGKSNVTHSKNLWTWLLIFVSFKCFSWLFSNQLSNYLKPIS